MSETNDPKPGGHEDPTAPPATEALPVPPTPYSPGVPGAPSYEQPSYGQPSYEQPSYHQPSYGQPSYGQTPPAGPYGSAQPPAGEGQGWGQPAQPAQPPVPPPPAYGQAPAYGQPSPYAQSSPYAQPYPGTYAAPAPNNGSALALTIVSGVSVVFCGGLFVIPALILGIVALTKQSNDPVGSRRMSRNGWWAFTAGIILSIVLVVVFFAFIISSADTSSTYDFDGY